MKKAYHNSFYAMGTRCNIVLPEIGEIDGERIVHLLKNEIRRIESLLSRFIPDSEVACINREARKNSFAVSDEMYSIIKTCKKYWSATNGAFDITLRPLYDYWNEIPAHSPPDNRLPELLNSLGMNHIHINDADRSVRFDRSAIQIDLGGFGKGYALLKVDSILHRVGIRNVFISFGESSVLTRGRQPGGDCWKLGVNDYRMPCSSLYTFSMGNGSLSTSGNFFVDDDGTLRNHRHVINPRSGKPVEAFETVSVGCASPVVAEMLSTALLVTPDESVPAVIADVCAFNGSGESGDIMAIRVTYGEGAAKVTELSPGI